ncbi:MAG TPA: hypothetical protein VIP70_13640 [Nitrososphaeraceae archaeon]
MWHDYSEDDPRCGKPNVVYNYKGEVLPVCDGSVQRCYNTDSGEICEINTSRHECEIEEEEEGAAEEEQDEFEEGGNMTGGDTTGGMTGGGMTP